MLSLTVTNTTIPDRAGVKFGGSPRFTASAQGRNNNNAEGGLHTDLSCTAVAPILELEDLGCSCSGHFLQHVLCPSRPFKAIQKLQLIQNVQFRAFHDLLIVSLPLCELSWLLVSFRM